MTTRGNDTHALSHGSWTGLDERGSPHSMRLHRSLACWDHHPERIKVMNSGGQGGQTGICISTCCPSAARWGNSGSGSSDRPQWLGPCSYKALSYH